jgi:hypothetical protein
VVRKVSKIAPYYAAGKQFYCVTEQQSYYFLHTKIKVLSFVPDRDCDDDDDDVDNNNSNSDSSNKLLFITVLSQQQRGPQ